MKEDLLNPQGSDGLGTFVTKRTRTLISDLLMCGRLVKKVKQIVLLFLARQAIVTKRVRSKQIDFLC